MTTEEKLQAFMNASLEQAQEEVDRQLIEYQEFINQQFEDHKKEALEKVENNLKIEKEELIRQCNKNFSKEQLKISRKLHQKQKMIKDALFDEVIYNLHQFMDSPDYIKLLNSQINQGKEFAKGREMIVYLDPSDESKISALEMETHEMILLSDESILGGCKIKLPEKNIIIDFSLKTKLEQAKEAFSLDKEMQK